MQVYLRHVHLEIAVDAPDHPTAWRLLDTLRAVLYSRGLKPTVAPFATSYSLNAYAGINSRGSETLRAKLPDGLRDGIQAKETKVQAWPTELFLTCHRGGPDLTEMITPEDFLSAVEACAIWQRIEDKHSAARVIRNALVKAPLMPDLSSSILHMWQALENLFGISSEITYRVSLLLAELCVPVAPRSTTYTTAKASYGDRSKIAHGSNSPVVDAQWQRAWGLLQNVSKAILHRGSIPSANDLTDELLNR
ncbi:HEPN domain-containing protein [Cypionkella sp.]|uniref:HEPN domain-containing protein n=1 Tax=Cypionkella sp. TaxID=2811411 RepID=UPI00271F068D|nr:HEPN domain-containing protein [Cypionkella sp.]MDO8985795.1 HEPN domain-containing protein [Cypionkella sp.]MDP2051375.1 HEPN domain-containing protein [Cypionkella sp.]